jgi:hypothetical protein
MIADLNPREFKHDADFARFLIEWHSPERRRKRWLHRMDLAHRAKLETADFARRLATTTDPYERCRLLGQNLSPRGKPMLTDDGSGYDYGSQA